MAAEVTLKSTKTEIFEALKAASARAEQAEQGKLNPAKVEKEKTEKKAVESAKAAVEQNIFSVELNNKFKDLQNAIASEESRLQELYGVASELQKLAVIIEAGRERQAQIDAENKTKIEEANAVLECLKTEYSQQKSTLQEEYDSMAKKLKLERSRELEEYQYNQKREREKENNDWSDEKNARKLELAKKEAQANAILAEAESQAEYIKTLKAEVEGIPALLESEKKIAVDFAVSELKKTHEYNTALADKDYQNALTRANDKITYLEKELETADASNTALQNKLDKAYTELRELATKTVESASGVKIISSGDKQHNG